MPGNRLDREQSPYLRQHAANPVDWLAWGDEAFDAARELDRPIFLSIGYATCHWCHVMAHESFEDEAVAEVLNRAFVSVKLDREERPDVDAVYMTVCQMMNGHGGWPLTVVLTPDLQPFFSGTYFPRESRAGRIGMLDLLPRIESLWSGRREDVDASAAAITDALKTAVESPGGGHTGPAHVAAATSMLKARFDSVEGGFGGAPKFPTPHTLTFLLRVWESSGDAEALDMVTATLRAMARGGIQDQLTGGFHRYSTDDRWHLPHFEKMLYDQALLALAYTEAWQATREDEFAATARRTLDYVIDEMTDPAGGFHSAEDADSEGEEGKYYVWTESELAAVLDDADVDLAVDAFGIEPGGNFRDEATGRRSGANVLTARVYPAELARKHGGEPAVERRLVEIRDCLAAARAARERPARDDKILADWNGLAIAALARAGRALDVPSYLEAALGAAAFVESEMLGERGSFHRWRAGEAAIPAMADDLVSVAWGHLELYEATYDPRHLDRAAGLYADLIDRFEAADGGFYRTASDVSAPLVRLRETSDGALPSANSIAALGLLRLARLTGKSEFEAAAHRALEALGGSVAAAPTAHTAMLQASMFAAGPSAEVVIVGPREANATRRMLAGLREGFHPRVVALMRPTDDPAAAEHLARAAPFTGAMSSLDGDATAYLCRDHACDAPRTGVEPFLAALGEV